ncbi:MAG: mannose-6-phosphate isomerase, partial [Bacteroidota bacterium]
MNLSNYDKTPAISVAGRVITGWEGICSHLKRQIGITSYCRVVVVFELYPGTSYSEVLQGIRHLDPDLVVDAADSMFPREKILQLTEADVTGDEVFGVMTLLGMADFFDPAALVLARRQIGSVMEGIVVVVGQGAALVPESYDLLVYGDMARWEIEGRMKRGEVQGLGVDDSRLSFSRQYKRGYFVDWRVCDRFKQDLFPSMDYVLDTSHHGRPLMVEAGVMFDALKKAVSRPFRVVPYFDPGPWGGQWMKQVCDLDRTKANFAWCFDCVPEENSLLLDISGEIFEIPAINLVFCESCNLLGEGVEARFGREFPIRFDLLDTMAGGNLSLQVHPVTAYIRDQF